MPHSVEVNNTLTLDFKKINQIANIRQELVPVVVQNIDNAEVLLLAWVNQKALEQSFQEQRAVFWSTSRDELWIKGATSGDYLELVEVRVNCEQNTLLYLVRPVTGKVCHTKNDNGKNRKSCFYRQLDRTNKLHYLVGY